MIRYICFLALAATLVLVGGPVSAESQTPSTSLPNKIDSILAAVAPAGHVVLATGSVYFRDFHDVICTAANVGTQPTMVVTRIVASDGIFNYGGGDGNPILVAPGTTIYGSTSAHPADFWRCEFEIDGVANNIRGALVYLEGTNPPRVVLEAR